MGAPSTVAEPSRRRRGLTRHFPEAALSLDPTTLTIAAVVAFLVLKVLLTRRASAAVVAAKIKAGATVVDVRSEAEFRSGAYRGAVNVPLQVLQGKLGRIPKDRPVVVYCASGTRSAMAARILRKAGYADVSNAGGLHHLVT
jgi:phage shock protein E